MSKHNETGNNTTYGLVNAYIREHGIEKTRLAVYGDDLNGEAVAITTFIDSRMARAYIRERLGGYVETDAGIVQLIPLLNIYEHQQNTHTQTLYNRLKVHQRPNKRELGEIKKRSRKRNYTLRMGSNRKS